MDMSPEGHADLDIKRVLGGLLKAAIGIGVLRTKYSGFHGKGKNQNSQKLTDRHSRLAIKGDVFSKLTEVLGALLISLTWPLISESVFQKPS